MKRSVWVSAVVVAAVIMTGFLIRGVTSDPASNQSGSGATAPPGFVRPHELNASEVAAMARDGDTHVTLDRQNSSTSASDDTVYQADQAVRAEFPTSEGTLTAASLASVTVTHYKAPKGHEIIDRPMWVVVYDGVRIPIFHGPPAPGQTGVQQDSVVQSLVALVDPSTMVAEYAATFSEP